MNIIKQLKGWKFKTPLSVEECHQIYDSFVFKKKLNSFFYIDKVYIGTFEGNKFTIRKGSEHYRNCDREFVGIINEGIVKGKFRYIKGYRIFFVVSIFFAFIVDLLIGWCIFFAPVLLIFHVLSWISSLFSLCEEEIAALDFIKEKFKATEI